MAQSPGKKVELQNYKKIAQVHGGWIPVLMNHLGLLFKCLINLMVIRNISLQ
jgi:hypothetical protein